VTSQMIRRIKIVITGKGSSDNTYFDNLVNKSLNKFKKKIKNRKFYINIFFYL
jgi:hypothetical protein